MAPVPHSVRRRRSLGQGLLFFGLALARGVAPEGEFVTRTYQPPRFGRPILMLTDLEIGMEQSGDEAVDKSEWQDFARRMRTAAVRARTRACGAAR